MVKPPVGIEQFKRRLEKKKVQDVITETHNGLMKLEKITSTNPVQKLERDRLLNELLKHRAVLPNVKFGSLSNTHPEQHRKLTRVLYDHAHFISQLSPNARRVAEG